MIEVRGVFPVWVSTERAEWLHGEPRVGKVWFKEIDAPFRKGRGVWFRVGSRSFSFGVQHRTRAKSDVDVLGREVDDIDGVIIGGWQRDSEVPQEDL